MLFIEDKAMTLQEIAGYLKVPSRTVLWMAQSGEVPATKVGAEWRFVCSQVEKWLSSGKNVLNNIASIPTIQEVGQSAKLPYPISTDRIIMDLEPGPKEHILSQLIQPAVKHGIIFDPHTYLRLLLDRENLVTTAIGNGIAIPHVHNPEISHVWETAAVIGICKKGVNYESLDGMPAHLFVLLCNTLILHQSPCKINFAWQPGRLPTQRREVWSITRMVILQTNVVKPRLSPWGRAHHGPEGEYCAPCVQYSGNNKKQH